MKRLSSNIMKNDMSTTQTVMTIEWGSHAAGYRTTATIAVTRRPIAPATMNKSNMCVSFEIVKGSKEYKMETYKPEGE